MTLLLRWRRRRKLNSLVNEQTALDKEMDSLFDDFDGEPGNPPGVQLVGDKLVAIEEKIEYHRQENLLLSAQFWRVYVPPRHQKEAWFISPYKKLSTLTPEAKYRIRDQIRERRIVAFGVVVGFSSVIQAIYAGLAFHLRR
jgi:hypothetical protein